MKKASIFALTLMALFSLPSCYKNYYDISEQTLEEINAVSFRSDVVPIATSGACGCHNNDNVTARQIFFSNSKTGEIYYSTIQSRAKIFYDMAKGGSHPGEGSIYFTPSQAELIIKWYDQGAKDDYTPPPIVGDVTYAKNIQPIYNSECRGSTCHGGSAISMDYTFMKNNEPAISAMMKTGGQAHPGGPLPVSKTTSATFLAWYAQGAKP